MLFLHFIDNFKLKVCQCVLSFSLRERLCQGRNVRPLTIFLHLYHRSFWLVSRLLILFFKFKALNFLSPSLFFFSLQIAGYIQELVTASGLHLKMGLVQTAYANGSSTVYASNVLVSLKTQYVVCHLEVYPVHSSESIPQSESWEGNSGARLLSVYLR